MAQTAGLQLPDLLILLRDYGELKGEEQLRDSMQVLLHAQTKNMGSAKSKVMKDSKSKTSPPNRTSSHATMEMDSEITNEQNLQNCVLDLIKISCHLSMKNSMDNRAKNSTEEPATFGSLLEILNWVLIKVTKMCKGDIDVLERVSNWLHHLVLDSDSASLKQLLLSEREVAKSVTTKMLALYGFSNESCSEARDYKEKCSQMQKSHGFLNDVFVSLVDTAQGSEGNVLNNVLQKRQYRDILQKLENEGSKIAPSKLAVLLQELWLHSEKPSCFISMCNAS